jgi:hypothetical protein
MTVCINIQTHLPHFKYTNQLILSFLKLTNIQILKIPNFIVFDDNKSINNFKNEYNYDYDLIYFLNTEEIINNFHLEFKEKKMIYSKMLLMLCGVQEVIEIMLLLKGLTLF